MQKIKVGDKYRHFKGSTMEVVMLAKNSETLEDMVIYKHNNEIWARPLDMFLSKEDISNRKDNVTGQKYRFEKIEGGLI